MHQWRPWEGRKYSNPFQLISDAIYNYRQRRSDARLYRDMQNSLGTGGDILPRETFTTPNNRQMFEALSRLNGRTKEDWDTSLGSYGYDPSIQKLDGTKGDFTYSKRTPVLIRLQDQRNAQEKEIGEEERRRENAPTLMERLQRFGKKIQTGIRNFRRRYEEEPFGGHEPDRYDPDEHDGKMNPEFKDFFKPKPVQYMGPSYEDEDGNIDVDIRGLDRSITGGEDRL
jgi:hypothetical protein